MSKITYEIDIASKQNKVWNKNFTLLTIGSFISMMGSYMASLAISFTVFDMTKSVFLFAMFNVAYYIPKLVITPLLGPIIDKYSRKKNSNRNRLLLLFFFFTASDNFLYRI